MELKVGMYVRTKKGAIEKVVDKYEAPYGYKVIVDENFRFKHYEHNYIKYVKKASYNLIDLIEVGDILILDLWQHENSKQVVYEADDIKVIYMYDMNIPITNDEIVIKSILTKEMFESMSYKVGELNES